MKNARPTSANSPGARKDAAAARPAPDWLGWQARRHPRRLCLRYASQAYACGQLSGMVDALCAELAPWLRAEEARKPVGLLVRDPLLQALWIFACARLHRPVAVLNAKLPWPQLRPQLARLVPAVLLVSRLDDAGDWPDRDARPLIRPTALPDARPNANAPAERPAASDPAKGDLRALQGYVFTSGSTGEPKPVPLTFGCHYWSALASAYRFGYAPADRWLHCMPLCHIGGLALLFRAVLFGFAIDLQPRFDAGAVKRLIETGTVTLASFVPTMLVRLLEAGLDLQGRPSRFRFALVGGAQATPALRARCRARAIPLAPSYGLTESCSHIAAASPQRPEPQGEGRPLMFAEIEVRAENAQRLPAGAPGHLWVRGPQVALGADADGWYPTGDMGRLEADGSLRVLDRRQDAYAIGGETVFVSTVIAALETHAAVARAWVQGLPDREWGWRLIALVEPRAGYAPTACDLRAHCRRTLSSLQTPSRFLIVEALPQTATGKVDRRAVHALCQAA